MPELNATLSEAVSELRQHNRETLERYEDLGRFYAPSECYGDVGKREAERANEIARKYGYENEEALLDAVRERTSHRVVYMLLS